MKNVQENYDVIRIRDLQTDCIIGVYPHERVKPQPISMNVELFIAPMAQRAPGLKGSVDYAKVGAQLRFLLERSAFYLLENAAEALCAYLLAPPTVDCPQAQIERAHITLEKPTALERGIPSLYVSRQRGDYEYVVEHKSFGHVDVIFETSATGIYRLRVGPGQTIPTHIHRKMDEHEMMLSSGLVLQGKSVDAGSTISWPRELPHRYENPTHIERTILCIDRPAFDPADEIVVDAKVSPVTLGMAYPAASKGVIL